MNTMTNMRKSSSVFRFIIFWSEMCNCCMDHLDKHYIHMCPKLLFKSKEEKFTLAHDQLGSGGPVGWSDGGTSFDIPWSRELLATG